MKKHPPPFIKWSEFRRLLKKLKNAWIDGDPQAFTGRDASEFKGIVWDICTQASRPRPGDVYNAYKEFLREYLRTRFLLPLSGNPEILLRKLFPLWKLYKERVIIVRHLFGYLDHFPEVAGSLTDAAHRIFINEVLEIDGLMPSVLRMVTQVREGEIVDRKLLKDACELLLGNEGNTFQEAILQETENYYFSKASSWILLDLCDYLQKAERSLSCEESELHFLSSNKMNLLEIARTELLSKHSAKLFEDENCGFGALLRKNMKEHLLRMHRLYSYQHDFMVSAAEIFKQHVTDVGTRVFGQEQLCLNDNEISTEGFLLECFGTVLTCFQNCSILVKALHDALVELSQKGAAVILSEQWVATFCNNLLENGGSDDNIEKELAKVLSIFEFMGDRDLFLKFYRQMLAKRLLLSRNVDERRERILLAKLKHGFGGPFTAKMEQMVMDMTLSREVEHSFEKIFQINPDINPGINLTVNVLTKHAWSGFPPCDVKMPLNLPSEIVKYQEDYMKHYNKIMPHKKLTWINSLGSCTVRGIFLDDTIELVLTTSQASVLLLFNAATRLSYAEIVSKLNLRPDAVTRLLQSLICEEFQVLNKVPMSDSISTDDSFEINSLFTLSKKIIPVGAKGSGEQVEWVKDQD